MATRTDEQKLADRKRAAERKQELDVLKKNDAVIALGKRIGDVFVKGTDGEGIPPRTRIVFQAAVKLARAGLNAGGLFEDAERTSKWASCNEDEFSLGDTVTVRYQGEDIPAKFITWSSGERAANGWAKVLIESGDDSPDVEVSARVLKPVGEDEVLDDEQEG